MNAIASLRFDASRPSDPRRDPAADFKARPAPASDPTPAIGSPPTLTALRSSAWFASWPAGALTALAGMASLRSFGAGQTILPEGTPPGVVVLLVKGRVRVVRRAEAGREVTLEVFRAGDLCTDALFDESAPLPNDWVAAETSLLLFIPRAEFMAQARSVPEAVLTLARDFERRLTRSKQMAAALALADAQARLYQILGRLAAEEGEAGPDGTLVRRCPTQQELGNMIGACRETVSRMIAELARQDLVALQGRKLKFSPKFLAQLQGSSEPQ